MAVFHFDLRHVRNPDELRVQVLGSPHKLGSTYDLGAHRADSLTGAMTSNRALAALSDEARLGFTHFAEVHDEHFEDDDAIRWVQVVRPTPPDVHLDECILMGLHLPESALRDYYRRRFELYARYSEEELRLNFRPSLRSKPRVHSGKLAALGVESLPEDLDEAIEVLVHAQSLVNTDETAANFVGYHPELASVQTATSASEEFAAALRDFCTRALDQG